DVLAEAVVAVGDPRDANRVHDAADRLQRLGQGEDVGVRHGLDSGNPESARPDGPEAGLLHEAGGEGIVRAPCEDDSRPPQERQRWGSHPFPTKPPYSGGDLDGARIVSLSNTPS